jgi:hypothetical protein
MDKHMQEAVKHYVEKRAQLGARMAAANTVQTFGVGVSDLARAVADSGNLLAQGGPQPKVVA